MTDPEAHLTDEETRQIIARAADRQEQAERVPLDSGTGLTLSTLQEVAREAGIDPLYVDAAAREVLLRREAAPAATRLGLPVELRAQRVIPGSVSDAQWERMVTEFREAFRKSGIVSQFGQVREWVSGNEASGMPVNIRLEPVDRNTLITLQQPTMTASQLVYAVGGGFSVAAALVGVVFAVGDFAPIILLLPILFLILALLGSLGAWAAYRAWMPRQEEQFRALLDRAELIGRTE